MMAARDTSSPEFYILLDVLKLSLEEVEAMEEIYGLSPDRFATSAKQIMEDADNDEELFRTMLTAQYPVVFNVTTPRDFTDTGNAEVVERRERGRMLYCDSLGWMVYDPTSGIWEANEHTAKDKCRDFTNDMLSCAQKSYTEACERALQEKLADDKAAGKDTGKAAPDQFARDFYKHAIKSRSAYSLKAMLDVCKTHMNGKAAMFDANPYDLNTPAGIVDLQTGEIRPHDPKAYCTYSTTCAPSRVGEKLWTDFLAMITCGDKALEDYLQLLAGMSATGLVTQEFAAFSIGGGKNGKSTFYGALQGVLGDYAGTLSTDVIIKGNTQNRFAFANIRGKRLIVCPELEENKTLSTEQLKRISSAEDPIDFEKKGKDLEKLPRTFHLHLFANSLPKVDSIDEGTWRRIRVIPFKATMPTGEKKILSYASTVLVPQAGGAILQWIIDGAVKAYKCGFNFEDPPAVLEETRIYRAAEDWLETFIADRCIVDKSNFRLRIQAKDLRKAWAIYARENMYINRSDAELSAAMTAKGFQKTTGGQGRVYWHGIGLKAEQIEPTTPYKD